jgi:hypothetical protein
MFHKYHLLNQPIASFHEIQKITKMSFNIPLNEVKFYQVHTVTFGYRAHSFMVRVKVMVFNVNFNYISVISWRSVLLVEETRVPQENHRPTASH